MYILKLSVMKRISLLVLLHSAIVISLFGVSLKTTNISIGKQTIKKYLYNDTDTTYRIVSASGNTYGYEILIKDRVFIRQLTIPGKSGMLGFKKKNDAEKVAQLVLSKLSKGLMPPTIDDKELRELKIKL